MPWWKVGCLGTVVAIALAFFVVQALVGFIGGDTPVDSMQCGVAMNGYHVHAHLSLFDAGQPVYLYEGIGWSQQGHCWYWLHTHDGSGIIHVEGPDSSFDPTLGKFFDVWHQPLSGRQFLSYKVSPGQGMRVYVNQRRYAGNPRDIPLRRHTQITIEIGPPFPRPVPFVFPRGL